MKKLLSLGFIGTILCVVLLYACSDEKEHVQSIGQAGINTNPAMQTRSTVYFISRISSTQTCTLAINTNTQTGALTVQKTVNTADSGDEYKDFGVGIPATDYTDSIVATVPSSGSFYFIPFDETQNYHSLSNNEIITYKCECCPSGATGSGSGCTLTGTIAGGNFSIKCTSGECTDCGLNATEHTQKKTGVFIAGTSVTIN